MARTDHPARSRVERVLTRRRRPLPRRQGTRAAVVANARREG